MMGNRKSMELVAWRDPKVPIASKRRARRHFRSPAAIGIIGTLLLHTLALQSVLLGSRAHKTRPPAVQGAGATLVKSEVEPAETLVLIELPTIAKLREQFLEDLASAGIPRQETLIKMISPDPLPHLDMSKVENDEQDAKAAAPDSGDGAERARLFGIYSGQIQARIERIWRRPRTPVTESSDPSQAGQGNGTFSCQVRIIQDARGNVQEVLLPQCNGTSAWQHSLVLAINQSSPLPAPPSPTVFSNAMALTFTGYDYGAGRSDGEYEIERPKTAQAALPSQAPGRIMSDPPSSAPLLQTTILRDGPDATRAP